MEEGAATYNVIFYRKSTKDMYLYLSLAPFQKQKHRN